MPRRKKRTEEQVLFDRQSEVGSDYVAHVVGGKELHFITGNWAGLRVMDDDGEELGCWSTDDFEGDPLGTLTDVARTLRRGEEDGD